MAARGVPREAPSGLAWNELPPLARTHHLLLTSRR
jgi:hypothetical protein